MKLMKVNAQKPDDQTLLNGWFAPIFRGDFDSFFDWDFMKPGTLGMHVPANIHETGDAYELELAAPGWKKEEFKIRIDGDTLRIEAEKTEQQQDQQPKQVLREFQHRSFSRSFSLDNSVDAKQISAAYENGILKIVLPKKPEVKAIQKEIAVQ